MPKPAKFKSRGAVELRGLVDRMGRAELQRKLGVTNGVIGHWLAADRRPDALNMQRLATFGIDAGAWFEPAEKRRARTGTEG